MIVASSILAIFALFCVFTKQDIIVHILTGTSFAFLIVIGMWTETISEMNVQVPPEYFNVQSGLIAVGYMLVMEILLKIINSVNNVQPNNVNKENQNTQNTYNIKSQNIKNKHPKQDFKLKK